MRNSTKKRATLAAAVLSTALVAVSLGSGTAAYAGVTAPVGNVGKFKQSFVENFSTTAAANGAFAKTYKNSWQPYPDAGQYSSGSQISSHDGLMDVKLDGANGAAGTFGTPTGAWSHVGGKFTVRAKATGGDGNGAAFMLWPSSNTWSDGEIDFPEGNFEATPMAFQHSMTPGQEANSTMISSGVNWRAWHTYSVEWIPGKSMTYSVDGKVIRTTTTDVPTTAHRYMFQVGNWGASGHLFVDWVSTYDYVG
ncbi:glycosyl hydrolase family 16 [Curtobacterium sp. PhB130]|uniref:glycoside hydrolase family 16 protein n=1 Tax=unclassified Curtobacterium TaxID=257496 RepID=UPI000F4CCED7|nr:MULTISPECIES: glycoside hydrolase family 16 protein [unclassified Curtobacterium]ROP66010.1 glycosyl hydrolase family 16 [Curtobacterium sp. ZW137]ROS73940.1 glycosyl hydrolase family 16 [Curtobacterium sp. PhB130]